MGGVESPSLLTVLQSFPGLGEECAVTLFPVSKLIIAHYHLHEVIVAHRSLPTFRLRLR
jgi:hypothetical protein